MLALAPELVGDARASRATRAPLAGADAAACAPRACARVSAERRAGRPARRVGRRGPRAARRRDRGPARVRWSRLPERRQAAARGVGDDAAALDDLVAHAPRAAALAPARTARGARGVALVTGRGAGDRRRDGPAALRRRAQRGRRRPRERRPAAALRAGHGRRAAGAGQRAGRHDPRRRRRRRGARRRGRGRRAALGRARRRSSPRRA